MSIDLEGVGSAVCKTCDSDRRGVRGSYINTAWARRSSVVIDRFSSVIGRSGVSDGGLSITSCGSTNGRSTGYSIGTGDSEIGGTCSYGVSYDEGRES